MTLDITGFTPLIQVFDMPTSMRFYCEVLGFGVVETNAAEPGISLRPPSVAPYGMKQLYLLDPANRRR